MAPHCRPGSELRYPISSSHTGSLMDWGGLGWLTRDAEWETEHRRQPAAVLTRGSQWGGLWPTREQTK
ncbi:hypothetical protein NDU88_005731 [Pleurodeles waltl]|uniref:Uncharacterized protein n=1 Tax=Pleurodeles waltl TaxID=8319 RepID=A0AAV7QFJ7_PLEWA|nr:hypothetical protein NDU88_005731 [Pleurodeles waltl]